MPDDAGCTVEILRQLLAAPEALDEVQTLVEQTGTLAVHQVAQLRRRFSAAEVHALLAVANARKKAFAAKGKWEGSGVDSRRFWAVPEALEQATDVLVARHKAKRFQAAGPWNAIVDVCCGIGGDALALAAVAPVVAIDKSPVRAWMARQNLLAAAPAFPWAAVQADAGELPIRPAGGARDGAAAARVALHIDPARRAGGQRSAQWADLIPGPAVLNGLLRRFPNAAIKLSSAVDFDDLPPGHVEVISRRGVAVQAVLWTGALADGFGAGSRTATVIGESGQNFSVTGPLLAVPVLRPMSQYVFEVDAAVHRAGLAPQLAGVVQCQPINNDGGYVTADAWIRHPALVGFRVLGQCGFREAEIAGILAQLPPAQTNQRGVEVKVRGAIDLNTDALQGRLQKVARGRYTVLVYRAGQAYCAAVAARMQER